MGCSGDRALDSEATRGFMMTSFNGEMLMQYRIEGMDCASCVGKIETALTRMPGVSDIRLNFATEKLELTLASDAATQAGDIEKTIKSLGFGVSATPQTAHHQRWWQTR